MYYILCTDMMSHLISATKWSWLGLLYMKNKWINIYGVFLYLQKENRICFSFSWIVIEYKKGHIKFVDHLNHGLNTLEPLWFQCVDMCVYTFI